MGEVCPRRCCPMLRGLTSRSRSTRPCGFSRENATSRRQGYSDSLYKLLHYYPVFFIVLNFCFEDSKLVRSLFIASQTMDHMANDMYDPNHTRWKRSFMGYSFSLSRCGGGCADHGEGATNLMNACKAWLRAHEEAQVMVASVLVVVGLWWLVRTILALIINLLCPLFVVLVAVMFLCWLNEDLANQIIHSSSNRLSSFDMNNSRAYSLGRYSRSYYQS